MMAIFVPSYPGVPSIPSLRYHIHTRAKQAMTWVYSWLPHNHYMFSSFNQVSPHWTKSLVLYCHDSQWILLWKNVRPSSTTSVQIQTWRFFGWLIQPSRGTLPSCHITLPEHLFR
jgi:hypothetical protein